MMASPECDCDAAAWEDRPKRGGEGMMIGFGGDRYGEVV